MYLDYATKTLNTMINLKKDKDYIDTDLDQLVKLTSYPGIWELKFKDTLFKMINIYNDDQEDITILAVVYFSYGLVLILTMIFGVLCFGYGVDQMFVFNLP